MLEQRQTLSRVAVPREPLDASTRLPRLTPIEHDASVLVGKMIEQLDAGVDALRRPLVERCVEPTRREHEDRGAVAEHFVARGNSVEDDNRHVCDYPFGRGAPLICRPLRTSSTNPLSPSSADCATFA